MRCENSAFNVRGSRLLIVVVVKLGLVKMYIAAAVEVLRKKERHDETQFTTKIDVFFLVSSPLNANVLLSIQVFVESHPVYDQTQGFGAVFFLLHR
jgi:hypothetical protein